MKFEELDRLLKLGQISKGQFDECIEFFNYDLEHDMKYGQYVYNVYTLTVIHDSTVDYFAKIHSVISRYLAKDVQMDCIWRIQFIELIYYFLMDSPSEVMRYTNLILSNEDERIPKDAIYGYAILVLHRLGLYDDALKYVDESKIFMEHSQRKHHQFHVWINALDVYASTHQYENYLNGLDVVESLVEESKGNDDFFVYDVVSTLHKTYGSFKFAYIIEPNKEEMASELQRVFRVIKDHHISLFAENYGTILIPVFDYLKSYFSLDEVIDIIKELMRHTMSLGEKVALYQYLIERSDTTFSRNLEIYKSGYQALTDYYRLAQLNNVSEVKTEIKNFSIEKKYNVISSKYQYDQLTGAYNRVFLSEIEEKLLNPGDHIIYMDLNDFKKINDTYGHDAGDKELQLFASILMKNFINDILLRLGGDEFVLIARGITKDILGRLDEARQEYLKHSIQKSRYGFSAGVLIANGIMIHEAIRMADSAMYDCKKNTLPCIIREV